MTKQTTTWRLYVCNEEARCVKRTVLLQVVNSTISKQSAAETGSKKWEVCVWLTSTQWLQWCGGLTEVLVTSILHRSTCCFWTRPSDTSEVTGRRHSWHSCELPRTNTRGWPGCQPHPQLNNTQQKASTSIMQEVFSVLSWGSCPGPALQHRAEVSSWKHLRGSENTLTSTCEDRTCF